MRIAAKNRIEHERDSESNELEELRIGALRKTRTGGVVNVNIESVFSRKNVLPCSIWGKHFPLFVKRFTLHQLNIFI